MAIKCYKDLIVWQKSMNLAVAIYDITLRFPKEERYGLISQLRRASVSVISNIAEGSNRKSRGDFRKFLLYAYASGGEIEAQLELVKRLPFGKNLDTTHILHLLNEILRMLNSMTKKTSYQ